MSLEDCPTPRKRRFKTQANAENEIERFWASGRAQKMPCRTYLCPCGRWHMASKPNLETITR